MFRKIVGIFLAAAVLLSCCGNLALAEQPTRITWYGVGGGSDHDARINETATKRLQELGFNVEFEYIEMGWGDYLQNYQIMLSAQEPFDLFNAQGNNVMQFAKNGGIVEITDEMMDTLLPDVKKVAPAHVVEGLKMEGKTYMVPSMHEWAQYYGFSALNLGIMETLDLDMSGIRSLDDLDPIFEKVHAAFPDVYCTRQADLKEITMMLYGIGPANHTDTFPISIKALEEDQDFFSTFENEDVIKVLRKWNEWYQKGWAASTSE